MQNQSLPTLYPASVTHLASGSRLPAARAGQRLKSARVSFLFRYSILLLGLLAGLFTSYAAYAQRPATGSMPIGTAPATYPLNPAGSLHVATDGDNTTGDGSVDKPYRTLQKAVNMASAGQTIVLHAGTYRGDTTRISKKVIIQPHGDDKVWLKGSELYTSGWTPLETAPGIYVRDWSVRIDSSSSASFNIWGCSADATKPFNNRKCGIDLTGAPEADYLEMIYVSGQYLPQVMTRAKLVTNSFYVDRTAKKLYVYLPNGENPNGKEVEITEHSVGIHLNTSGASGTQIKGIGVAHYAMYGISVDGPEGNAIGDVLIDGCTVAQQALHALVLDQAPRFKLTNSRMWYNDGNGVQVGRSNRLLVESNILSYNNQQLFEDAWNSAGIKVTLSDDAIIRGNQADGNIKARGIWLDIDIRRAQVVNNVIKGNGAMGIFFEISNGVIIAGNTIVDNVGGGGIRIGYSRRAAIYNNTMVNNGGTNIQLEKGYDRPPTQTMKLYRGFANVTSMPLQEIVIKNNIFSDSRTAEFILINRVESSPCDPRPPIVDAMDFNAYYRPAANDPANLIRWSEARVASPNVSCFFSLFTSLPIKKGSQTFESNGIVREAGVSHPFFADLSDYTLKDEALTDLQGEVLPDSIATALGWSKGSAVYKGAVQPPVKTNQTIAFEPVSTKTYGEAPFRLNATATSGLPVSFRVVSGPASLSGNTLTLTGAGVVLVQALQGGNEYYLAAPAVAQTFTVNKADQTITFALVGDKTYGDSAVTLSASASSGLSVFDYAVLSGADLVTLTGNNLTIRGTGTVTLQVIQPGSANYRADTATQSFTIGRASQAISFPYLGAYLLTGDELTLPAVATSGLGVSYSVSGPATLSGSKLTITGSGLLTITALQGGNENYLPATSLTQSLTAVAPLPDIVLALNAGSAKAYVSSGGIRYEADHYFSGGQAAQRAGISIAATENDSLYQSERLGNFRYAIPLSEGVYEVYFEFAELALAREKSRVFSVQAEGKELIKSLDVFAQAGFETAYRVSHTLLVKDGTLNLDFESLIGQAQLSGLVIEKKTEVGVGGQGLWATYFNNVDFTGTHFSRRDGEVDFDWSDAAPHSTIEPESYSVRWTGQVHAQYSQPYTFSTQTDDGVRLWVNGLLLIDHWPGTTTGVSEQSGTITLKAGQKYDLKMEYYQHTQGAVARLLWSSPSQPKQIIPQKRLSPAATPAAPLTNRVSDQLKGDGLSADLLVSLAPNPASQVARLHLQITGQQKVLVVIYNPWSREVMRVEKTLQAGQDLPLPVHRLPAGTYMIAIRQGSSIAVKKLIVNR